MTTSILDAAAPAAVPKAPYRGIEEFRYLDAPIFFGRDFEARRLLRLITVYRGVLLYGDSGVGKSSLVNAKATPMAVEDGYAPERIRVQPVPGAEFIVERIVERDEPEIVYLPSLFARDEQSRRVTISASEFWETLGRTCRVDGDSPGPYPLLIFDQFEELVTLTEQASRRDRAAALDAHAAYERVVQTLVSLLRDDTLRVKLLFVFREDYYAKLTGFFARFPTLVDNYLRVEELHSDQLEMIIIGPFQRIEFDHKLPDEVVGPLMQEFRERSDSDLLNLSEVQIACLRLWKDPDPKKLLAEKHVSGLLETYFSEAISALPERLRGAADLLLDELVTDSGTRNVASAETLVDALFEQAKIPREVALEALTALEETAHVIRRERRSEVVVYEIVSEFLVPWIMRRKVEAQAQREYETRNARMVRQMRFLAGVTLVILAIYVVTIVVGQMRNARDALQIRLREEETAHQQTKDRLDAAQTTIKALEATSSLSEKEMLQKLQELQQKLAESEQNLGKTRALLNKSTDEARRLQTLTADLQKALSEAKLVQQVSDSNLAENLRRIESLKQELSDARALAHQLEPKYKDAVAEREDMRSRYTAALKKNQTLTDENKNLKRDAGTWKDRAALLEKSLSNCVSTINLPH